MARGSIGKLLLVTRAQTEANQDLNSVLRTFGLRKYEASVYASLVRSGTSTALEISRKASIPLPRIYTTIKSLQSRGYLSRIPGSPARYRATHPGHVLRAEMSTLRTKIESILIGLEQEYELASSLQTQMPSTIEFTSGENGAIASIIGFFSTAHSEIIGMIDDLSWSSEEGVLSMMKEMKKRQLKLRIIGKRGIDTEDDLIIFRASTGATVKSLPESEFASSFLIKDKSELIINVGLNTAGSESVPSTLIVRDPRLVQVFGGLFEESWKKALPLED